MKKVLSSMLALTLCVGAFGFPVNVAIADDETPAGTVAGTFKMAEGASVCVSDPGIRFRVEIADDVVETAKAADDFGFLVFPQEYLATAKANVEAGTAENYHDKFDGELEDGNVVPADKVGTYGLFDYAEVSMTDEDLEAAVYTYEKDGKQYVNVIYQDEILENVNVELTALAWYKTGETYTYAELNESFSRSVAYVAQQEYIAGEYSRAGIMTSFPWLAEDTFEIRNGKDMYELSAAVQAGETFEGISFELTRTIAVINDYVAVPETFAGKFYYRDYAILVVDNEVGKAFASDTYNVAATETMAGYMKGVKALTSKLVDAAKTTFWTGSDATTTRPESVEATVENAEQKANYCNYTGAIAGYSSTGSSGTLYLSVKTNNWHVPSNKHQYANQDARSYWELEAMKEWYSSIDVYMFCSEQSLIVKGRYTVLPWTSNYYIAHGYWQKLTFPIDEIMDVCYTRGGEGATGIAGTTVGNEHNGSTLLPLVRASKKKATMIYVGDCVFAK